MKRKISSDRVTHLKKMASRLGKDLPTESHARCLDIVAHLEGFPDWRAATLAVESPSPSGEAPNLLGTDPNDLPSSPPWDDEAYVGRLVTALHEEYRRTGRESLFLGFGEDGAPLMADLGKNPHSLFLGKTGSGKTSTLLASVYVMAKAFPGTEFLFADGKGGKQWEAPAWRH